MAQALVVRIWKVISLPISHVHIYMEDAINNLGRCWLVCTGCCSWATQNGFTLCLIHSLYLQPMQQKLTRHRACVAAPYSQRLLWLPGLVIVVDILWTTHGYSGWMARAGGHELLWSLWSQDSNGEMQKCNRNLAKVIPRGEIFPEMNLHRNMKSKTDNLG